MTDCALSVRGQGHVSNFYIFFSFLIYSWDRDAPSPVDRLLLEPKNVNISNI